MQTVPEKKQNVITRPKQLNECTIMGLSCRGRTHNWKLNCFWTLDPILSPKSQTPDQSPPTAWPSQQKSCKSFLSDFWQGSCKLSVQKNERLQSYVFKTHSYSLHNEPDLTQVQLELWTSFVSCPIAQPNPSQQLFSVLFFIYLS